MDLTSSDLEDLLDCSQELQPGPGTIWTPLRKNTVQSQIDFSRFIVGATHTTLDRTVSPHTPTRRPTRHINTTFKIKSLINLSKNLILSPAQLSLLGKGLTFIHTKGSNKNVFHSTRFDLQQYHRKLKIAAYFEGKDDSDPPPFTPKSDWSPPLLKLPEIVKKIIQLDIQYFHTKFKISRIKPNLTKAEIEALNLLQNNHFIIIKPTDKGSADIIMDRDQYVWEGNDYTPIPKPIYVETIPMVEKNCTEIT